MRNNSCGIHYCGIHPFFPHRILGNRGGGGASPSPLKRALFIIHHLEVCYIRTYAY